MEKSKLEEIMDMFDEHEEPLTSHAIRIFTGMHSRDVSEKLKQLEKNGEIKSIGNRRVNFYKRVEKE